MTVLQRAGRTAAAALALIAASACANSGLGNAVMFQISPALRHRVSAVTGSHARTAYAGWFRSAPDFHDLFFASLPKS